MRLKKSGCEQRFHFGNLLDAEARNEILIAKVTPDHSPSGIGSECASGGGPRAGRGAVLRDGPAHRPKRVDASAGRVPTRRIRRTAPGINPDERMPVQTRNASVSLLLKAVC